MQLSGKGLTECTQRDSPEASQLAPSNPGQEWLLGGMTRTPPPEAAF